MVTFLNWKLRLMGLSQLPLASPPSSGQASRGGEAGGGGLGDGAADGVVSRDDPSGLLGVSEDEEEEEGGVVSACWQ